MTGRFSLRWRSGWSPSAVIRAEPKGYVKTTPPVCRFMPGGSDGRGGYFRERRLPGSIRSDAIPTLNVLGNGTWYPLRFHPYWKHTTRLGN